MIRKRHQIVMYILLGIFLLPSSLNFLHFAWVNHQGNSFELGSNQLVFHKPFTKNHNCEQFFFKIPPITNFDLSYKEISNPIEFYEVVSENLLLKHYQNNHNFIRFLRGPPIYRKS